VGAELLHAGGQRAETDSTKLKFAFRKIVKKTPKNLKKNVYIIVKSSHELITTSIAVQ
jgi:hypothetical protein